MQSHPVSGPLALSPPAHLKPGSGPGHGEKDQGGDSSHWGRWEGRPAGRWGFTSVTLHAQRGGPWSTEVVMVHGSVKINFCKMVKSGCLQPLNPPHPCPYPTALSPGQSPHSLESLFIDSSQWVRIWGLSQLALEEFYHEGSLGGL